MKAYLILEDGTVFTGTSIGSPGEVICEIVFNTSMTGYLEVLTDPSYAGQAVVMTYPLIGNYGVCREDKESSKPWVKGLIVRELSGIPSNFRSGETIQHFLESYAIPGICHIDTRALTKLLRENGTMNGMITTEAYADIAEPISRIKAYQIKDVVRETTTREIRVISGVSLIGGKTSSPETMSSSEKGKTSSPETMLFPGKGQALSAFYPGEGKRVALLDLGAKENIARSLHKRGCEVTIYPAWTKAEEILAADPDGIMLSNGPGDPAENVEIIREIRKLYESDVPVFAICLGHQLMALATGASTYKLKYGHRGGNHPVKDLETGRVYITSQNHGYAVDASSLDPEVAVPAFVNVNDGTNEGLRYIGKNIFTVQFHPEACPGPLDSGYLFDQFLTMMEVKR